MINSKDYKDFLKKKRVYQRVENLWKTEIEGIIGQNYDAWVHNVFANGAKVMDGNPIFSAVFDGKAIRIIQLDNHIENPIFATWLVRRRVDNRQISELVISLQLKSDTFNEALELIKLFNENSLSSRKMQNVNSIFQEIWNKRKYDYFINITSRPTTINFLRGLNASDLYKKRTFNHLRRYDELANSDLFHNTRFKNTRVNAAFNRFQDQIHRIGNLVTIDNRFPLATIQSGDQENYIDAIQNKFNNLTNFVAEVRRTTTKINEEIRDLRRIRNQEIIR